MAVSNTMSSSGSDSLGRHRNASRTGFAIAARSSRTRPTSALLSPQAARCCGRVSTASYSRMSGTESSNSNCRFKAANKSWREAPLSLRSAATTTSVSRTQDGATFVMILHAISSSKWNRDANEEPGCDGEITVQPPTCCKMRNARVPIEALGLVEGIFCGGRAI